MINFNVPPIVGTEMTAILLDIKPGYEVIMPS